MGVGELGVKYRVRPISLLGLLASVMHVMDVNDWVIKDKPYDLRERLFNFACVITRLAQFLHTQGPIAIALSAQLLRKRDAGRRELRGGRRWIKPEGCSGEKADRPTRTERDVVPSSRLAPHRDTYPGARAGNKPVCRVGEDRGNVDPQLEAHGGSLIRQVPSPKSQLPNCLQDRGLGLGSWKLDVGGWKLEVGSWSALPVAIATTDTRGPPDSTSEQP